MMEIDISTVVQAVQFDHFDVVRHYVGSNLISASSVDGDECSLLHWAAINNRVKIALFLLHHGANVNKCGGLLNESPIHWAIRKNLCEMVDVLIQNGADLSIKSGSGLDPLHLACHIGMRQICNYSTNSCVRIGRISILAIGARS